MDEKNKFATGIIINDALVKTMVDKDWDRVFRAFRERIMAQVLQGGTKTFVLWTNGIETPVKVTIEPMQATEDMKKIC